MSWKWRPVVALLVIAIAFLEVGLLYEKYFKYSKKALGVCAIIWAITMCLNSKVDLSAGLLGNPFFIFFIRHVVVLLL